MTDWDAVAARHDGIERCQSCGSLFADDECLRCSKRPWKIKDEAGETVRSYKTQVAAYWALHRFADCHVEGPGAA